MKDYKPRPRQPKRKTGGGTLVGIFIGLALGLLIAVSVALYMTKMPVPFVNKTQTEKKSAPQADRNLAEAAKPPATPEARNGDKPRFDFYKILPGQEVPVTDKELKQQARDAAKSAATPKENYFIQAGAFQSPADADSLKARLALIGLQASVEPANVPDKGTLYRVRLGPYSQLEEINRVRQTLAQNGMDAALVKLRPN